MKTYGKANDIKHKNLLIGGESNLSSNKTKAEKIQEFSNYFKGKSSNNTCPLYKPTKKKAKDFKPILQSVLNFGQKRAAQKCKDCLMEYNPISPDDLALHKKYHASIMNALYWNVSSF